MNTCTILFLFAAFAQTQGVIQKIELYSEPSQAGNSITWVQKIPDLKDWKFFLANAKSYCVTGGWTFFDEVNFYGSASSFWGYGDGYEGRTCGNFTAFSTRNSVRYWGPADTRTMSVSIYEGTIYQYGGIEVVVEGRAATNFPMNQTKYVVLHGRSNWTLFTEDNFGGESWCFGSNGNLFQGLSLNATHPVRSVIRDCDSNSVSRNIYDYRMGISN